MNLNQFKQQKCPEIYIYLVIFCTSEFLSRCKEFFQKVQMQLMHPLQLEFTALKINVSNILKNV